MNMRKLVGALLGLTLSATLVAPATAQFQEDVRAGVDERVDAELSDIDDETSGCSVCDGGSDDGDDEDAEFGVSYEDYSGIDDGVRESVSGIDYEVRDSVLEGSED